MTTNVTIFLIVLVLAAILFAWSCRRRFGLITRGQPDNRFDAFFRRFWNMVYYAFFQKRVVAKPFGINHFVLFWAFMVLLIANAEFILNGLFPETVSFSRLP